MVATQILAYYRQHSLFTDPGVCADLYADLPHDVAGLAQVVQGLIIHPGNLNSYNVKQGEIDNTVFGLHRVENLLQRMQRRYTAPLTVSRPPALRIGAICRNFAVLLVSMLRQQGIPARARVGFGGYFSGQRFYDHRITEYWNSKEQRWVLTDAMIDDVQRQALPVTFNSLDIAPTDPFKLAGEAWLRCRAGELAPHTFGDSDTDIGMPPIRYALLQDFAYLNKCEMLGNDDWGELITKPEATLTSDDLALLDRIATLTLQIDTQLAALRTLFTETPYGQSVRTQVEALV
ncbi:MAG TPA: transglutaminase-like domain-containing protein [Ktedonobacteraceae bacterium]|nr:transglutaminase-like domain-containing protein [Ktedonobacteraceae bacterium]